MSDIGTTPGTKKPRIFYGYWMIAVSVLCLGIFSGCGVGSFSIFVTSLQSEFGWGRGEIMLAFTISFLFTGLTSPLVGGIVDRYGVRGVMAIGSLVAGLGFASLYMLQHLWHLYLAFFFIGTGTAATAQVPASTMVSNWFVISTKAITCWSRVCPSALRTNMHDSPSWVYPGYTSPPSTYGSYINGGVSNMVFLYNRLTGITH